MVGPALRLAAAAARRRADAFGAHARARATHVALLAGFALTAAVFLVALATVALAEAVGLKPALAIMAGVALAGCVGVLVVMRAEGRTHAAALRRSQEDARVVQAAFLASLPAVRRGGLVAAALGLAAALLIARRGRDDWR
jgi:hypothetical protein